MTMMLKPLRGTPGFSVFLVLGTALTIGLVSAALSLGDMLSDPPLHVSNPDELVAFFKVSPLGRQARHSYPLFTALRDDCRSCGQVAAAHLREITFELDSWIDSIGAEFVSDDYFTTLGLKAGQGRLFGPNDSDGFRSETVVVVGEGFSRKYFRSGDTVGSKILLNGHPSVVVGVVAGDFTGLGYETDVWLPLDSAAMLLPEIGRSDSGTQWLSVFARPGESLGGRRASAEVEAIVPRYREADLLDAEEILRCGPEGFPWTARLGNVALLVSVFGGGGVVALLALCLNAALVVLAHSAARRTEVAIKLALGASGRMILAERARDLRGDAGSSMPTGKSRSSLGSQRSC